MATRRNVTLGVLLCTALGVTGCGGAKQASSTTETTSSSAGTVSTTSAAPAGPLPRTISGAITYGGSLLGSHRIVLVVARQGDSGPPAYSTVLDKPGPYAIANVTDGSYSVLAFIDLGDDMGAPAANEPSGFFDAAGDGTADVLTVAAGVGVSGVDVVLRDPAG